MSSLNSPVAILRLLEKTNCRECGEKTCMAFASKVFQGRRRLHECPRLDRQVFEEMDEGIKVKSDVDVERDKLAEELQEKAAKINLQERADAIGGQYKDGCLQVSVMGKNVALDQNGTFHAQIHLHSYITIPILSYIVYGQGKEPLGQWTSLRELPGGREYEGLYRQRIELPLKDLASQYAELFENILLTFSGIRVEDKFDSDLCLMLHPLPKVPLILCYWSAEDGMQPDLKMFFDSTAVDNMGGIRPLHTMTAGLASMFLKIAQRHT